MMTPAELLLSIVSHVSESSDNYNLVQISNKIAKDNGRYKERVAIKEAILMALHQKASHRYYGAKLGMVLAHMGQTTIGRKDWYWWHQEGNGGQANWANEKPRWWDMQAAEYKAYESSSR